MTNTLRPLSTKEVAFSHQSETVDIPRVSDEVVDRNVRLFPIVNVFQTGQHELVVKSIFKINLKNSTKTVGLKKNAIKLKFRSTLN